MSNKGGEFIETPVKNSKKSGISTGELQVKDATTARMIAFMASRHKLGLWQMFAISMTAYTLHLHILVIKAVRMFV